MSIKVEVMDARLQAGLPEFASKVWDFPEDPAFLRWLFVDAPKTTMFVAHDDGRWMAALGVFERTYSHDGGETPCFETYGWASMLDTPVKGLGIKCMKAAFDLGRPLVALGGSKFTEDFMPRLGFSTLAWAPSLTLPLSGRGVPGSDIKRRLARLGLSVVGPWLRPAPRDKGAISLVPASRFDQRTLDAPTLPGFQATFEAPFFEWQFGYPEQGTFLPFRFMRDNEVAGWTFGRVAREDGGLLTGRILETKFAPWTTAADQFEMMRTVVAGIAGFGVSSVKALTTCPETVAALRKLRFLAGRPSPAMIYLNGLDLEGQTIRVSVQRADGGVLPLPTRAELAHRGGA